MGKGNRHTSMNNDGEWGRGVSVLVRNGDVTKAIRKLKKKVQENGVLYELKKRQHYEKPSTKRQRNRITARKRWLKKRAEIKETLGV
tara:strand:+ start:145 stop:405 length:261 start_codon:yes stop_codon:yes gene_type:complete